MSELSRPTIASLMATLLGDTSLSNEGVNRESSKNGTGHHLLVVRTMHTVDEGICSALQRKVISAI